MYKITIDVFSGRPNPVIELKGKKATEFAERLTEVRNLKHGDRHFPKFATAGYRGLIVEQTGKKINLDLPRTFRYANGDVLHDKGGFKTSDEKAEAFVLDQFYTKAKLRSTKRLENEREKMLFLIDAFKNDREEFVFTPWADVPYPDLPIKTDCMCGPAYEPLWWGDANWNVMELNNCYNYATNYRTETFAQPGKAHNAMYDFFDCQSLKQAAVADKLIDFPRLDNNCPTKGHLVALVIDPGWDYHWYRKDNTGYWSHKLGSSPAIHFDNSGNLIADPRDANRGNYTNFCTFMVVHHGRIKVV